MSHFAVAVFTKEGGKTVEQLLAPYQENNMGDCPAQYLEFNDQTGEVKEDWEECADREEYNNDIKTFAKDYHGYKEHEGKFGYWENPNAKWDWWVVGGRWSGLLLTKNGEWVDSAKIKDIDWEGMKKSAISKAKQNWEEAKREDRPFRFLIYDMREDDTEESYTERQAKFRTFATLSLEGKWHEKGEVGWWACHSATPEEEKEWDSCYMDVFINGADPELTITIVDCHI